MTLDTNILIAYLGNDPAVVRTLSEWREGGRALLISSISVAEVLSLARLYPADIERIKSFLQNFIIVPFDSELAEVAAYFRRLYRITLPDAAIAATAFTRNVPLVTRDRQFRKIKELTLYPI